MNMNKIEKLTDKHPKIQLADKLNALVVQPAKARNPSLRDSNLHENGQEVPRDADVQLWSEGDEAILKLECPLRKYLLDILQTLSNFYIAQASRWNGHFTTSLKAKVTATLQTLFMVL